MRWASEVLLRETSVQAGVHGRREGSGKLTRQFGRWGVLFEGFAYAGERLNLLRDTAGGIIDCKLQNLKKNWPRLLNVVA